METQLVPMSPAVARCKPLAKRVSIRTKSADEFIEQHASGTLRKNKRLNMSWRSQYLHERVVYDFGWGFEIVPKSRVTFGDPITEGDCKPITEAGWFCERYLEFSIFPEDYFEVKYLQIDYGEGKKREGIGLIVRKTSANWLPKGHIVFAIVAEFDPIKNQFLPAENPF
jgi:hypothetical protein